MKRLLLAVCLLGGCAGAADLAGVHKVYVLPMARGLDQYLANRLTTEHVFQVVTDPKTADAVLTDRIGEGFEAQMESLFPPPPAPPKEAAAPPKGEKKSEKSDGRSSREQQMPTDTLNKLSNPALNSSFGRGKGTVFLVDTKSRQIVWSVFNTPRGIDSKDLDRTASDIVSRLKLDLNPGKK